MNSKVQSSFQRSLHRLMSHRFFVETPIASSAVILTGDEAHHLSRVMRAQAGDVIWLFDGSGQDFEARIVSIRKQEAVLEVISQQAGKSALVPLTLAVALPKGDRQHWLVEKLTELGVSRLIPLTTQRGVASPGQALERMQRWMIEACKQCERSRLMEIASPCTVSELIALPAEGTSCLVAHPGGNALAKQTIGSAGALVAIGPEGGFTDDEIAQLVAAGFTAVSFGPLILRVETAAIAAAAVLALGLRA